ncbi:MAG: hypothetical protein K4445_14605, partial [Deltaproteobacteria bacterium]
DGPIGELFNRFLEKQSQINGESPPDSLAAPLTKKDVFFKRPVGEAPAGRLFFLACARVLPYNFASIKRISSENQPI